MMNKLTVVVFCYNHEKFIAHALDSILQQKTDFPFTVFIVDDASTDGSRDIILRYSEKFPLQIKALLRNRNLGSIENYRQTMAMVRSEYVIVNDGDDYFTDTSKLQKQVDFLETHPDHAICFHPVQVAWDGGTHSPSIFPELKWFGEHSLKELLEYNFMQTNSVMYRWAFNHDSLLDHLPEGMLPNDHFLHLLHAEKGRIGFLPDVMAVYRRHDSSLWDGAGSTDAWFRRCAGPHILFYKAVEARWGLDRSEQIRWMRTRLARVESRRHALYVLREQDGMVRDYVIYYLNGLKEVAQDITVIVSGPLSEDSRKKLETLDVDIFVRNNQGLNFSAWKDALQQRDWDSIKEYEELILCDSSCYGPVYPFSEAFRTMEARECDFWGMARHPKTVRRLLSDDPERSIKEHIQSFFMVFRKKVLSGEHFRRWWEELDPAKGFVEEVEHPEVTFTEYLESAGYTSSCLVDMKKYFDLAPDDNVTLLYADRMLVSDRMPLIQRKLFVHDPRWWIRRCMGHVARDVFRLLKERTGYPEAFIWQDLLATQKFSEVKDVLHLNYILPSELSEKTEEKTDTALLCFAYYPDLCASMCRYIASMPEDAHICIISSREDTLDAYRAEMAKLPFRNVEYRLKPNRGRDVSAYLVTGRDILQNHELVCCIHDKKSKQLSCQIMAEDFGYHCMECCLHSKEYVRNIIALFHKEPFCGLLVPPTVYYGDFCTLGAESFRNKKSMAEACEMLSLSCPMDDNPVAPFGAYFWARGAALAAMFRHDWKYEDFPDEPLPVDSTISHGIERIYPLAVQDEGYYTAWCSPDIHASLYMNNLSYMMREYNKRLYRLYTFNNWAGMVETLDRDIQNKFLSVENIKFNKIKYYKYKVLSKITFGIMRNYYKKKYKLFKKIKKLQED